MFVVLSTEGPIARFSLRTNCNYTHVALISVDNNKVAYVLGDFVDHSQVDGRLVGVVGLAGAYKCYIPINIRRKELSISLVDDKLALIPSQKVKVVLHLKTDR